MNSYQFKVGDKGFTRSGADYEVIAVVDRQSLNNPVHNIVALVCGYITTRQTDGRFYCDTDSTDDLMLPKRYVWVNFYRNGLSYWYDTEQLALGNADDDYPDRIGFAVKVELP